MKMKLRCRKQFVYYENSSQKLRPKMKQQNKATNRSHTQIDIVTEPCFPVLDFEEYMSEDCC